MASGQFFFRYYTVTGWPEVTGGAMHVVPEGAPALPGFDRAPQTIVERDPLFNHRAVDKYKVTHERWVNDIARFRGERVRRYIGVAEFDTYRVHDTTDVYIRARKTTAEGALRALRRHGDLNFTRRRVDIKGFQTDFKGRINQAFFRDLAIHNVRAATIYGDNVRESAEYDYYYGKGEMSGIAIELSHHGLPHTVMVTRDNAISFRLGYEYAAIDLVQYVNEVLDPYATLEVDLASADGEVPPGEEAEGADVVGDDF